jgi:hypothetical protein
VIIQCVPPRDILQRFRQWYFISDACRRGDRKDASQEKILVRDVKLFPLSFRNSAGTSMYGHSTVLSTKLQQGPKLQLSRRHTRRPTLRYTAWTLRWNGRNGTIRHKYDTLHYSNIIQYKTRQCVEHNTTLLDQYAVMQYTATKYTVQRIIPFNTPFVPLTYLAARIYRLCLASEDCPGTWGEGARPTTGACDV